MFKGGIVGDLERGVERLFNGTEEACAVVLGFKELHFLGILKSNL